MTPTPKLTPLHEIARRMNAAVQVLVDFGCPTSASKVSNLAIEIERHAGHQLLLEQDQAGMVADQLQPLCPILKLVREAEHRPRSNDADNETLRVIREGLKSALGAPV